MIIPAILYIKCKQILTTTSSEAIFFII